MANITKEQLNVLINIIGAVETGGQIYGKQRYDDYTEAYANSSAENSITIGAFQEFNWYAKALLQEIFDTYPNVFRKYDNAGIESDLKKTSWVGYSPSKNSEKAKTIKTIISSKEGIEIQNVRIERLLKQYIKFAEEQGVCDVDALFMCANWIHQGGNSACTRLLKKAGKPYTLDRLYQACTTDTGNQVGAYKTRQKKVYDWLKEKVSIKEESDMGLTKDEIIQAMLKVALNEVGYLEKASNAYLDDPKKNNGFNNYTKYWRDVKPEWNGQSWCCCYISWVFMKVFGLETAKKLLKHWPYVYCPTLGSLFTKHSNPEVGDIVIFYRNGVFTHTGLVTKVEGDLFHTVEGNTSSISGIISNGGAVEVKKYYNSSLPGTKFCRPDYSIVKSINPVQTSTSPTPVAKNYLELGDRGEKVKELQQKLNKLGFKDASGNKLTEDGDFGNNTLYALKAAQKKYKLTVDGKAGKNTISALDEALKTTTSAVAVVGNKYIKEAQKYLNKYFGFNLKITGTYNSATKKAFRKAAQKALNADYGCKLVIDGEIGANSQAELRKRYVQKGSEGMLVTVVEIGMLLNKIDPSGVECPGSFGNGLDAAVRKYQKNKKLTQDGSVGYNTFMKLIG